MSDLTALLQQALALHQAGDLRPAAELYRQVLEKQPQHFDALHLLGVIARQNGEAQAAVELIRQALAIDASQAVAHCNLGAALQDLGQPEAALASYERAICLKPDYAMALQNRGNALRILGRVDAALLSYDAALAILPDYPEAFYHRGLCYQALGQSQAALDDYQQALQLRARYPQALCASGVALHSLQHYEAAIAEYENALRLQPDYAEAWCNRGSALHKLQEYEAALDSYQHALEIRPDYAKAHEYCGNVWCALEQPQQAIAAYQQALACGGDASQLDYLLATLGVGATPVTAPSAYVRQLFDQYAGHFDQHLQTVLGYQLPALLDAAITRQRPAQQLATLDAGCGTGLCGPYLRPYSHSLSGVDLSEKMLEQAAQTSLYDELTCAELSVYLMKQPARFDLIMAADVLVYIGDLAALFAAAKLALRSGGLFAFSVEQGSATQSEDFYLQASHRYAHSGTYVQRLAHQHGFSIAEMQAAIARQDQGADIDSWVVVLKASQY
ncbi:tetratricopeptide repeat protein [Undibacterium parvum]|uniref:Tetratricopeptide repeat protein n=1 Tax=Undibacterium parvum TaxID=401471 RepID=A0A3Q9BQY4_9BURK|nr:tetratricopeptide repeat protein [Undibacterium parvum]AZP11650.1 tetratricopeptide repeat protein [Undibacterium parvum]